MGYIYLRKHCLGRWILTAVLVLMHLLLSGGVSGKCLQSKEVFPKRYLHFQDKLLNITIEASDRVSHQLTSHVFKIYAEEVLGYQNITIKRENQEFVEDVLRRLSGSANETMTPPETMINLEVWVPPDFDLSIVSKHVVKACGFLRAPGRFGWYIPKKLTKAIVNYDSKWSAENDEIYWTIFKDAELSAGFSINDRALREMVQTYSRIDDETFYCNQSPCTNGIFTPETCKFTAAKPCALLLAPWYNESKFLISHINELNLRVEVIWLGPNLKKAVGKLRQYYLKNSIDKSVVFLGRKPSDLVFPEDDFIRVGFKECESLNYTHDSGSCHYEMVKLEKFAWGKLETYAKHVYRSLRNFEFTNAGFEALLDIYYRNESRSYEDIACEWLRTNTDSWKGVWQVGAHEENTLYIGGIFPLTGSMNNGSGMAKAAIMAKDAINRNNSLLQNYNLRLIISDGQCRADKVMKKFIDFVVNNENYDTLIGVVGPGCSDTVEPLAGISKFYKTMVISYSAEGANFSDREKYPYFFRTIAANAEYIYVYLELMKRFGWKRISALAEDGQKYTEYISHMKVLLENSQMSLVENIKFPRERDDSIMIQGQYIWKNYVPSENVLKMNFLMGELQAAFHFIKNNTVQLCLFAQYLQDLKKVNAKIIIADVDDKVARHVMCEAHKMEMSMKHGYVWFLPVWLHQNWYNTSMFPNESVNCSTDVMIEAINGYLSVTHEFYAPDNATMQEGKTVGQWRKEYQRFSPRTSDYGGYAYDAMWVYAEAMDKLINNYPEAMANLHSENTTNKLLELVQDTNFYGVSGKIEFRNGPSRYSKIELKQWYYNSMETVGFFYPNVSNYTSTYGGVLSHGLKIRWPSGKLPHDGTQQPTCALDSIARLLNVPCDSAIIIMNFVGIFLFVTIVGFAFFKMRNYYEQEKKDNDEYMRSLGINLKEKTRLFDEKWEMNRNNVVVTRKLGDGAFGIVYGGEARFTDGWINVAVKTLKEGSSAEDKVDFLREAEAMKCFEHPNIVKLLGVCTEGQPILTVMELMVHGDLKTYLLSRRNLIKHSLEKDEVSSERLTSMALDVAKGLSYIHDLKYTHRDIACRNCMVSISKVVKIGDFGMTRPVNENDIYKFCRKGLLPVRWMAPESLGEGLFSYSTDVWSYGVLLFEIITFGGFPFSGMPNKEVLTYVQSGKTLEIPAGVKQELEALMKSCWKFKSQDRPAAKEIVQFLADHPRLITPCVSEPQFSVEHDNSDISLPSNFIRLRSEPTVNHRPPTQSDVSVEHTLAPTSPTVLNQEPGRTDDYSVKEPLLAIKKRSEKILSRYVRFGRKTSDVNIIPHEEEDYVLKDIKTNHYSAKVL